MIVAINKIDLPQANPDRVKQQLSEAEVMPEEYGGDVPVVEVSAREKLGIDDLLEVILLVADIGELKANPHKPAVGVVIEAKIDRSRGVDRDGAGAVRHAQATRLRGGRRDLRPDSRHERRPGGKHAQGRAGDAGRDSGSVRACRRPATSSRSMTDEKTARALAEERSRQKRAEAFTENARRQARRHLHADPGRRHQGAADHRQGRRPGLARRGARHAGQAQRGRQRGDGHDRPHRHGRNQRIGRQPGVSVGRDHHRVQRAARTPAAKRAADTAHVDIRFYDVIYHLVDDIKRR